MAMVHRGLTGAQTHVVRRRQLRRRRRESLPAFRRVERPDRYRSGDVVVGQ